MHVTHLEDAGSVPLCWLSYLAALLWRCSAASLDFCGRGGRTMGSSNLGVERARQPGGFGQD